MAGGADNAMRYVNLQPGDAAPWFRQRCTSNESFAFDTAAGRYILLGFHVTAADDAGRAMIRAVLDNRDLFDDEHFAFFGVSLDRGDEAERRVAERLPGIRYFWDFDAAVARAYGATPLEAPVGGQIQALRFWLVLDPTLRVMARFTADETAALFSFLRALPPPDRFAGFEVPAPILVLPNTFEPTLCRTLIETYEREGGEESGFMREIDGRTRLVQDPAHKRRRDCTITNRDLVQALQARIIRRVVPEIRKVYAFEVTRMERYIVGCYDAGDRAHFRAHRDNTTAGTAHRRFAVSINLNGNFDGGELSFPEYGPRRYKAPAGTAIVFPCALLHAVSAVTSGRRYAFLPFLYDDAAAKAREANSGLVEDGLGYRANAVEAAN